jgi:hypothetical protein
VDEAEDEDSLLVDAVEDVVEVTFRRVVEVEEVVAGEEDGASLIVLSGLYYICYYIHVLTQSFTFSII